MPTLSHPLPRSFYVRPTLDVARELVGKVLVHESLSGLTAGIVVEVEAYIGEDDPACHASTGFTRRNAPLYGPPGRAYVYLNYGVHHLVNVVTEREGLPAAVLLRAVEPLHGLDLMRRRRNSSAGPINDLCRGPGKLSQAFGISISQNRQDFTGQRLYISDYGLIHQVTWTSRIGIRVGVSRRWRCYASNSLAVSLLLRAGL